MFRQIEQEIRKFRQEIEWKRGALASKNRQQYIQETGRVAALSYLQCIAPRHHCHQHAHRRRVLMGPAGAAHSVSPFFSSSFPFSLLLILLQSARVEKRLIRLHAF
jgi:hypothetical protein